VVDDEAHNLVAMEELLAGEDRNIVLAASGREALKQILKVDFAIVLLDIRMPDMDGFETATLIRQLKRSRHLPIMFLTAAYEDMRSMFRGYEVGAVDYIVKPVDPAVLKSKVAVFVDLYQKSAELATQVQQRRNAERKLYKLNEELEAKVRDRTASLIVANEQLRREVDMRKQVEEDLKKAMLAAEAANLAKSAFLANMSHEIRTPMNAIIGMTELARQTLLTTEQREYLDFVQASADSLLTVINDILDFSKIEAGKLEIESIGFSLRTAINEAIKTLALEAHRKGLEMRFEIAPHTPESLVGEPTRLRQILLNLVGNAIKFTERGEVAIHVWPQMSEDDALTCHFTVSDTGMGIPEDKLATIFAPFLQADTSTTRLHGGTGLGLTISARLVEMMQGKIWVESQVGKGSTFHFTVRFGQQAGAAQGTADAPRHADEKEPAVNRRALVDALKRWKIESAPMAGTPGDAARAVTEAASGPVRTLRILLVEDNPVNRNLAQHVLEKDGHQVITAENGALALEILARNTRIDLVLMDVQMPRMDGLETTMAIRKRERFTGEHVPIIALTAHAMAGDRERCLEAGMDSYLVKPIRPATLLEAIDHLQLAPAERPHAESVDKVVLDRTALLERVDGDPQLLAEISELFFHNCDKLMDGAKSAMHSRNAGQFTYHIHTLNGMLSNLAALAARDVAAQLEETGLQDDIQQTEKMYGALEEEVVALKTELKKFGRIASSAA
jgi:signal transduction histidine kinase/HPt (histidine-containing phosphotransfer) domain-containing protein